MKHQRILSLVLIAIGLCFATSSQVHAQASKDLAANLFDLKFRGGTAVEYIDAIRKADDLANIVVTAGVALIEVEPLELKQVGYEAAVYLLDHMTQGLPDGRQAQIQITMTPNPSDGLSIYRVDAHVDSPRIPKGRPPSVSSVWSLASITRSDTSAEDILTAIETALDLFGDSPKAELRFHNETSLLMLRGNMEQAKTVESIIYELAGSLDSGDLKTQLEVLKTEHEATRKQMAEYVMVINRSQARAETAENRAERAEREASRAQEKIKQIEDSHASRVATLTAIIQGLERQLKERKD